MEELTELEDGDVKGAYAGPGPYASFNNVHMQADASKFQHLDPLLYAHLAERLCTRVS